MRKIIPTLLKVLAVVVLLAAGLTLWQVCAGGASCEKIDKTLPAESVAPHKIVTKTYYYFAQRAQENDDHSVTMTRWYELDVDEEEWIFHEESFTIPPALHPKISAR